MVIGGTALPGRPVARAAPARAPAPWDDGAVAGLGFRGFTSSAPFWRVGGRRVRVGCLKKLSVAGALSSGAGKIVPAPRPRARVGGSPGGYRARLAVAEVPESQPQPPPRPSAFP